MRVLAAIVQAKDIRSEDGKLACMMLNFLLLVVFAWRHHAAGTCCFTQCLYILHQHLWRQHGAGPFNCCETRTLRHSQGENQLVRY